MTTIRSLRTPVMASVAALGCVLLPLSQANATAFAYSALSVENFQTNIADFGGFTSFDFIIQDRSVSIGGVSQNAAGAACNTAGCSIDVAPLIHSGGTGYGTDNQYFGANKPTAGDVPFAVTDAYMTNTVIGSGTGGVFGVQAGSGISCAPACNVTAASQSGTDLSMQWNFTVSAADAGQDLVWSFDMTQMRVAITTDDGETAVARLGYEIQLIGPGGSVIPLITGSDPNLNATNSNAPGQQMAGSYDESSASLAGLFANLAAGEYSFNIVFDASTNVRARGDTPLNLPEPGTLGLIGLGLIGLGAAGRRKRAA